MNIVAFLVSVFGFTIGFSTAGDNRCYVCSSYMEQCKTEVDTSTGYAHRGRCYSKCFIRLGSDGAIYRGCFDGFDEVPFLRSDYNGCQNQEWNGESRPWCFCEGDLCNKVSMEELGFKNEINFSGGYRVEGYAREHRGSGKQYIGTSSTSYSGERSGNKARGGNGVNQQSQYQNRRDDGNKVDSVDAKEGSFSSDDGYEIMIDASSPDKTDSDKTRADNVIDINEIPNDYYSYNEQDAIYVPPIYYNNLNGVDYDKFHYSYQVEDPSIYEMKEELSPEKYMAMDESEGRGVKEADSDAEKEDSEMLEVYTDSSAENSTSDDEVDTKTLIVEQIKSPNKNIEAKSGNTEYGSEFFPMYNNVDIVGQQGQYGAQAAQGPPPQTTGYGDRSAGPMLRNNNMNTNNNNNIYGDQTVRNKNIEPPQQPYNNQQPQPRNQQHSQGQQPSNQYQNQMQQPTGQYQNQMQQPTGQYQNHMQQSNKYENQVQQPTGQYQNPQQNMNSERMGNQYDQSYLNNQQDHAGQQRQGQYQPQGSTGNVQQMPVQYSEGQQNGATLSTGSGLNEQFKVDHQQQQDPYFFPPHLAERIECAKTGFYQNPDDCRTFVACILDAHVRRPYMHLMRCPETLVWDNTDKICNQFSTTCNVGGQMSSSFSYQPPPEIQAPVKPSAGYGNNRGSPGQQQQPIRSVDTNGYQQNTNSVNVNNNIQKPQQQHVLQVAHVQSGQQQQQQYGGSSHNQYTSKK